MIPITALMKSKRLKIAFATLVTMMAFLFIFKTGEAIGEHKARFSYRWTDTYHRIFGDLRSGFFKDFNGRDFLNSHGIFGVILSIDDAIMTVKSNTDKEQSVLVSPATTIRRGRTAATRADLVPDTRVIVIGSPNVHGQIEAKFIRVFDAPAASQRTP